MQRYPEQLFPKEHRFSRRSAITRGVAIVGTSALGAASLIAGWRIFSPTPKAQAPERDIIHWAQSPANPVLDVEPNSTWDPRAVYDPCVARRDDGALLMWFSARADTFESIALAIDTTGTGDHWTRIAGNPVVLPSPPERYPYYAITRPAVLAVPGGWRMWYSTIAANSTPAGLAWIGTATSADGIHWKKYGEPVLAPRDPWEKNALQCPNVIYDDISKQYMLWYCGGERYEPDAVGFATSPDGIHWTRPSVSPMYTATTGWEDSKIGSFQVRRVDDWFYAFYNAFQKDPFRSQVGMARSRDGVTNWQRHPANPIFSPGRSGTWDAAMVYKPTALWDAQRQRWDVWYNASQVLNQDERIGHAWSDRVW